MKPEKQDLTIRFDDESIVYTVNKPLILEASAGSGKTTVLVERYVQSLLYLMFFENMEPIEAIQSVVAVTFTRKAASEMKDRIRRRLQDCFDEKVLLAIAEKQEQYNDRLLLGKEERAASIARLKETMQNSIGLASISTIHSFGLDVLRKNPVETGIDPAATPEDPEIKGQGIESLSITSKDAFFLTYRKLIDKQDPDLAFCIEALGFKDTRSALEDLHKASQDNGFEALDASLTRSGYINDSSFTTPQVHIQKKVLPLLQEIRSHLIQLLETVRKNSVGPLEETIRKIDEALSKPETLFSADIDYKASAGAVLEAVGPLYNKVYYELHRAFYPPLWSVFQKYMKQYQSLKDARREISFSDIETSFQKALAENTALRNRVQKSIRFLLIDEYQDTSDQQQAIFDLIILDQAGKPVIPAFLVGDPKQSIYGFRNANVELFSIMKARFSSYAKESVKQLYSNYRSSPAIVEGVNNAFQEIFTGSSIAYQPQKAGPNNKLTPDDGIFFIQSVADDTEGPGLEKARTAAGLVKDLVNSGCYQPGDIMVLLRETTSIHYLNQAMEEVLTPVGIPFYRIDRSNILENPVIKNIICYLKALEMPESDYFFLPLLKSPFFRKTDPEILQYKLKGSTLFEAARREGGMAMELFLALHQRKSRLTIAEIASVIISESGYNAFIQKMPDRKDNSTGLLVFLDFLRKIQALEMFNLTDFLYYLSEYEVTVSRPKTVGEKSNVVKVMTCHGVKGLESKVVLYITTKSSGKKKGKLIIRSLKDGLHAGVALMGKDSSFGKLLEQFSVKEEEEEKRLAYVAFTRAKERFYYIGVEGETAEKKSDGWSSFINLEKDFVQKHQGYKIPTPSVCSPMKREPEDFSTKIAAKAELLIEKAGLFETFRFPSTVTITQLLDIEFQEASFKNRYIYRSFPVDEALNEIATEDDSLLERDSRMDEGTFLHKILQFANANNYKDFIHSRIIQESDALITRRDELFQKARSFFESPFYQEHYSHAERRYPEWELNYPVRFQDKSIIIKGALDMYIRKGEKSGIIIDYKLKVHEDRKRYERQLCYYALILKKLSFPVTGLYLFDMDTNQAVEVPVITEGLDNRILDLLGKIAPFYGNI